MQIFKCGACGQLVYFENTVCTRCNHELGFDPRQMCLVTGTFAEGVLTGLDGAAWARCRNAWEDACNWLVPAGSDGELCPACALNRTIPDLSVARNRVLWQSIEAAKRRLVYALMRFGLPLRSQREAGESGLAFDFLSDAGAGGRVMTGHADGLVTINIAEADPAERERRRADLAEPLRTLLGHLRHEVGHYYWDLLVRDGGRLEEARAIFGDERADYAEALRRNYEQAPPADWQERHVSAYAAAHPWEDFAETWTHYFHIVDTLDTASAFGLGVDPQVSDDPALSTSIALDPYRARDVDALVAAWLPLTYAVNSLNRSMGQPDLYPFVLSPVAIGKLGFVHRLIRSSGRRPAPPGA
jgi:hypothetical protein